MSDGKRRVWLGGYVREGRRGPVFVIERWVEGRHFHLSTRCRTERAALDQLAEFERDPWAYQPRRKEPERLTMTPALIDEHEEWQRVVKRNTPAHIHDAGKYLEDWMVALLGRELTEVTSQQLKACLLTWKTASRHRVIAIKGFYRWLREEKGLLTHAQDATLDLPVPAFRPAKLRRKRAVDFEAARAAIEKMEGECRQVMELLAATGMHYTEVRRFAEDGELFGPTEAQAADGTLAFLHFLHKSGHAHVVSLGDPAALAAARAVRARGTVPARSWLTAALHRACDQAKVPRFSPGVMRHSVATWLALLKKVPLPAISEFLGHRSPVTTGNFYRDMGHTAHPLPVPSLRLVKR